ncbi:hypothetical protein ACSTS3_19560 [Aquimarina muelleri]|uniref:hypothetical protein n=1 Tax=Aquimarina muelleri TaxID=279356 RepID=UPI003F687276
MKAIRSQKELRKKLKKHNIAIAYGKARLTDYHNTPVNINVIEKMYDKGEIIKCGRSLAHWFEEEYKLK